MSSTLPSSSISLGPSGPETPQPHRTPRPQRPRRPSAQVFRRRRLVAGSLVIGVVATGAGLYAWERGQRADRVEAARIAAVATEEQLRGAVVESRESLEGVLSEVAPAAVTPTDLPAAPDAVAGGDAGADAVSPEAVAALDADLDPAVLQAYDQAVAAAQALLTDPVEVTTRATVVEGVPVDVPVTAFPSTADLEAAEASLATAAADVERARLELASGRTTSALTTAQQLLDAWEPIAADPATLADLRGAVETAAPVLTGETPDVATLESWRASLESATAAHPEVVADGVGPTRIDGVPVVNKAIPLPETYDPGLLPEAAAAFEELRGAAAADGLTLWNASGYRSHTDQQAAYAGWVDHAGRDGADRFSSRPGHSEHQLGLAIDVNDPSPTFRGTPEAAWVAANAHRFGFVVRYPEGKEAVTGYVHEPWHLRHVGVELATHLSTTGLTLEEHLGIRGDYLLETS